MANQLQMLGAQNESPSKYATLYVNQIFTGYWTNRNPLREGAVPFLYQKFYNASRNDSIIDGLNTEVSPRMTLTRRFGHSVYNSATFTNVQQLYSFKPFQAGVGETVIVVADTPSTVYNATGPSTQIALFSKSTSAKSRFQSVENTLYWGDGTSTEKWSWFPAWRANTSYAPGTSILDAGNSIHQVLGYGVAVASTSVTSNVATVNYTGAGIINAGDTVTLYGLTSATGLNGVPQKVLSAGTGFFTVKYSTSNYSTTGDTGAAVSDTQPNAVSGGTIPAFTSVLQSIVVDNTAVWVGWGNSVQNMGIAAPVSAPSVGIISLPVEPSWAASTYYWNNNGLVSNKTSLILDSNTSTGPWVWNLTTSGTTNSSVPSGLTTGTPTPQYSDGAENPSPTTVTDGTAAWTCNSLANWQRSTAYSVGQAIVVAFLQTNYPYEVSIESFFECVQAGTTSSGDVSSIAWGGGEVFDGTVVWEGVGISVTRTSSSTAAPTNTYAGGSSSGNVGDSFVVSTVTEISDSNGNGEAVIFTGYSGSSAPTWGTTLGSVTSEPSGLYWVNKGPLGSANTGDWFYAFSYINAATGDESTASPLSVPVLLPAQSGVVLNGPGSPDPQVGLIGIYRSTQTVTSAPAGNGPFLLATIPAPAGGAPWSYTDTAPDPPAAGSTLDILITASGYAVTNGIVTNLNDPPPAGLTNLVFYLGRMWGSVSNVVYYSTGPDVTVGNGATAWDAENFYELPGTVYRLWPTTIGLYILTNDGTYIITGLGTSSSPFSEAQLVDQGTSISSYDAFNTRANQAIAYLSDSTFISIDATNGSSDLGEPIGDVLAAGYAPSQVYVTSHRAGLDKRFFLTNGSTSWVNLMAVPTPETGYCWSPPATLVATNGASCVASIETSPGTYQLLVGPAHLGLAQVAAITNMGSAPGVAILYCTGGSSLSIGETIVLRGLTLNPQLNGQSFPIVDVFPGVGEYIVKFLYNGTLNLGVETGGVYATVGGPILFRDPNNFTDNGTPYEAFAVVGNIVLAHPGQMAAPAFVTIRAVNNAGSSAPAISVLADEIYGQPNTPSFATLQNPANEPPRLPASATLWSLRYWMIASQEPVWMQHMLLKVDFGAGTTYDELLDYGIFGKYVTEKA